MKIIINDKVTNTPSTRLNYLSSFTPVNIKDDLPVNAWISKANFDQIRVNVGSSTSAFFLGNVKADQINYKFLSSPIAIHSSTAITQANPAVITTNTTHGLVTGSSVYLEDIQGMIELNDQSYVITVIDTTSFSLDGIDSSAYTAHTAGTGALRKFLDSGSINYRNIADYTSFFQGDVSQLDQSWVDFFDSNVEQLNNSWTDIEYSTSQSIIVLDCFNTFDKKGDVLTKWVSSGSNTIGQFQDVDSNAVALDEDIEVGRGSIIFFSDHGNGIRRIERDGTSGRLKITTDATNPYLSDGDYIYLDDLQVSSADIEISNQCFEVVNVENISSPFTFELVDTEYTKCTITSISGTDLGEARKVYQLVSIIGNGTATTDLTLSPSPGASSLDVAEILNPAQIGVMKAGFANTFNNPQKGAKEVPQSFSVRDDVSNGFLATNNRNVVDAIDVTIDLVPIDFFKILDFAKKRDSLPFACLKFDNLDTNSRHAFYCVFESLPVGTHSESGLRQVSFKLREYI